MYFLKSEYLELQSLKEKLEQRVKDFEGNDDDHQNTINKLTKENNELKRQVEEMKVSKLFRNNVRSNYLRPTLSFSITLILNINFISFGIQNIIIIFYNPVDSIPSF